jgi:hypothetical protein
MSLSCIIYFNLVVSVPVIADSGRRTLVCCSPNVPSQRVERVGADPHSPLAQLQEHGIRLAVVASCCRPAAWPSTPWPKPEQAHEFVVEQ